MLSENHKRGQWLVAAIVLLLLLVVSGPRLLLLVPLLWLPGAALVALFFPRGVPDGATRLLLSTGLSVVVLIGAGLLLNLLETGITPLRMGLLVAIITTAVGGVAYSRREIKGWPVLQTALPFSLQETVLLATAVTLAVLAVMLARQPAPAASDDGYTVLWTVPERDGSHTFDIGIENQELRPLHYKLELRSGDQLLDTWDEIELEPGEVWEEKLTVGAGSGQSEPVELLLYRLDQPDRIYRYTTVWQE